MTLPVEEVDPASMVEVDENQIYPQFEHLRKHGDLIQGLAMHCSGLLIAGSSRILEEVDQLYGHYFVVDVVYLLAREGLHALPSPRKVF